MFTLDSVSVRVSPFPQRVDEILGLISHFQTAARITYSLVLQLLGQQKAALVVISLGLLSVLPRLPLAACLAPGWSGLLVQQDTVCQQVEILFQLVWDEHLDPEHCSAPTLLKYFHMLLDNGLSVSTIKVYVATISAQHVLVDHQTSIQLFSERCSPIAAPHVVQMSSWDLLIVLESLCSPLSEPLEQADLRWLSGKTSFLFTVASAKWSAELHSLSIARDVCVGILMGLGYPCGPAPHFFLRGFQLFTSIRLLIWQFLPCSQGCRNCFPVSTYFVLFRLWDST